MLRLVQLWQNFQETALSLERLSDILDTPQEVDADIDKYDITKTELYSYRQQIGIVLQYSL